MLIPTITKHWSDTKTIHVIGYFGGKAGDVYLRSEDAEAYGTRVSWPQGVKSSKPPISLMPNFCSLENRSGSWVTYYASVAFGNNVISEAHPGQYIQIFKRLDDTEIDDETDLETKLVPFYAIFPKF